MCGRPRGSSPWVWIATIVPGAASRAWAWCRLRAYPAGGSRPGPLQSIRESMFLFMLAFRWAENKDKMRSVRFVCE